jgi:hypothetical protein
MADVTKQELRDIVFMYDPQAPRFVSLVKRGANQTPFRVVKNAKEDQVKVVQSIIATKGTGVEVIKTALGQDIAGVAKLENPVEAAGFVTFEQMPREAFKADTFQLVSLTADKSILGLQGELVEKSEGFVAKLFKPAEKSQVISVPEDTPVVSVETYKSALSNEMWEETDALYNIIRGALSQEQGSSEQKLSTVRTAMNNFIASLEMALVVMKCARFDKPEDKSAALKKEDAPKQEPAKAESDNTAKAQDQPKVDADAIAEQAAQKAEQKMAEALKPFAETLKTLSEEVAKMQKAPASVVTDRTDDGVPASKSARKSETSVFKGIFGSLG